MSRPLRIEFPGACYHVSASGNAGGRVFFKDSDRRRFLDLFGSEIQQQRWLCHGFVLLDDSYRLLIETPEAGLGRGMARLNARYTQAVNRRAGRSGHLFQGRYRAVVAEKAAWLLPLARDLAWAPVRAGLAKKPGAWPWSSHRALAKDRDSPAWLTQADILDHFASAAEGRRRAYRAFVAAGESEPSPLQQVRGQIYLGGTAFLKEMAEQARTLAAHQVPAAMFAPDRPTEADVIAAVSAAAGVAPTTVLDRSERTDVFQATVYLLRRSANLPLRRVAGLAGVSPGRISQIQRAIEDAGGLTRVFPWARPLRELLA
jgi:hypothetical protein